MARASTRPTTESLSETRQWSATTILQATRGASVLVLALALCGCSGDRLVEATHEHAAEETAATYKAGRGLMFNETATAFIGLETAGVETRDFPGAAAAAAVPVDAVVRTVRGDFVYVENGGWFLRTPVRTGAAAGGWREVRDGLYEGDDVVVRGARALWLAEIQAVNGGVSCTDGH